MAFWDKLFDRDSSAIGDLISSINNRANQRGLGPNRSPAINPNIKKYLPAVGMGLGIGLPGQPTIRAKKPSQKVASSTVRSASPRASSSSIGSNSGASVASQIAEAVLGPQSIMVPEVGWDPNQMASAEFDPQLQALLAAKQQLEAKYSTNYGQVGNLYNALADRIAGQTPVIQQTYDTSAGNIKNIYDEATQAVAGTYNREAAEQEAIMRRLGLQEAAPDALAQGTEDAAFAQTSLEKNAAANQALMQALKANAVTANEGYSTAARVGGTNAQADLTSQFQDLLGQYGLQEMQIQGQKAGRAAELARQLESTNYDRGMDAYQLNRQAAMDQFQMMQAQQEALAKSQPNFNEQWKTMSPTEKVMYKAQELSPGNAQLYYNFIRNVVDNDPAILNNRLSASEVSRRVRAANKSGSLSSATLDNLVKYMVDTGAL